MRHAFRLFLCAFLVLTFPSSAAPKLIRAKKPVKDSYIVVLNESERGRSHAAANDLAARHGAKERGVVQDAFPGFIAQMNARQAEAMLRDPRVRFIEEDAYGEFQATQVLPDFEWYALDRIDQRARGWATYPYTPAYNYCQTGSGVKAYVFDTGVWAQHVEFWTNGSSRVTAGLDETYPSPNEPWEGTPDAPCTSRTPGACDHPAFANTSHGTSVASIIAGNTYGVAKNATIVPIRVSPCNSTLLMSTVIRAVDAVINMHAANEPAVANMSFVFPWYESGASSLATAINQLIADGVQVVASAGNQNLDAASYIPANIPGVITVGGSDHWDRRWVDAVNPSTGSNWGTAVDIFAPASMHSAAMWSCDENTGLTVLDAQARRHPLMLTAGTSFSAAMVSGVIAQYLEANPTATPAQVTTWLVANATSNALATSSPSLNGSPNKLLYTYCQ